MARLRTLINAGRGGKIERTMLPACLPFSIEPPGATEAVLLLHGFTGNPSEMNPIAGALVAAGYAVHAPRYPGHGSFRSDFLATDAADWLRRAYDARLELGARYETVHVMGHSMGGVIAATVASAFPTQRLVLLAPAFLLTPNRVLETTVRGLFPRFLAANRPPAPEDRDDPVRRALHEEYWKDDLLAPSVSLGHLARACRKNLARVEAKTLTVLGSNDATVPVKVGDFVSRRLAAARAREVRVIEGAGHLFPFDARSGETARIVTEWMSKKD